MKFTNCLLPCLVLVTLFIISVAGSPGTKLAESRTSTSGRTSHGRGDSGKVGASATYASRTQASGRNQPSGTSTQNQPQPSRTSTRGRGHHANTQSPTTLRTTSMPSGVISTASVEVCLDDRSPAESCFDYFTLAIIWTPGYAFKQSLQGQSPRKNTPKQWSIHGLWPSMYSRAASIPSRCNRTDVFFSLHQMNNIRGLREKLDNTWYSILTPGFTNTKLWEHEFIKHGNCCTRSRAIRNCGGYFTKTYELFSTVDIATTLYNARYRPGTVDSLRNVINIIEKKHQKKVKVDFVTNTGKRIPENYLAEVFICYDTTLAPIDCPNAGRADFELEKPIIYLNQLLTKKK